MSLTGIWIDPDDDNVVTVIGSPEISSPEIAFITAITDKSESGNDLIESKFAVTFLANFDGDDGATAATDASHKNHIMTFQQGAELDTAQKKFGTASLLLVESNDDYVTIPDHADFDFGDGDFTVEAWIRFAALPGSSDPNFVISHYDANGNQRSWIFGFNDTAGVSMSVVRSTSGSSPVVNESTISVSTNTWYHVAWCRNGADFRMFLDGVQQGSTFNWGTDSLFNTPVLVTIGCALEATNSPPIVGAFDGWIDDVRVIKGEALYTATFTVPSQAHVPLHGPLASFDTGLRGIRFDGKSVLTKENASPALIDMDGPDFTVIAAISDHNRGQSTLLIDFDGVDAATSYTTEDSVGRTVSFVGTAQLDTADFRFGISSLLLDGNSDYVSIPSAADLALGTGDFTIELFIKVNVFTNPSSFIFEQRDTQNSEVKPTLYFNASGSLRMHVESVDVIIGSTLSTGIWYHIMLVRKSGTTKLYLDGVQDGGDFIDSKNYLQAVVLIGTTWTLAAGFFNGWIDSVRVIKGVALPPDEPIFGVTGDASPLDDSGWRMNRSAMNIIAPSVGDALTNVIPLDTPVEGDMIVSMMLDSSANYFIGHVNGIEGGVVDYDGTLGFLHDLNIGLLPGNVYELVYVDRVLRTDERQRVEGYMAHKWGLVDSLPVGHPFELQAPDIVEDSSLVANLDGVDAATSYTSDDSTGRVATFFGNAQLDTAQKKFGTASLLLDGTGDYITFPDSSDFVFGSGQFTVECWVRFNGAPGAVIMAIIAHWETAGDERSWLLEFNNNTLRFVWSVTGTGGGGTANESTAWTPVGEQWYHIAVSRDGSDDLRFFVDGVLLFTVANAVTYNTPLSVFSLGAIADGTVEFNGWIDGVRVTKGQALYLRDFDIPHRGFVLPSPAALLANFNGDDAATSYTSEDAAARSITFEGTAQLDTAQKKFGKSSLLLDGNSDWVSIAHDADFVINTTQDHTIECWIRRDAAWTTANKNIINKNGISGTNWPNYILSGVITTHLIKFSIFQVGSAIITLNSSTSLAIDTWMHIAITWDASDDRAKLYINGVEEDTGTSATTPNDDGAALTIGHQPSSSNEFFGGHIDGIRIVQDRMLYTANFTPPIDALGEPIV